MIVWYVLAAIIAIVFISCEYYACKTGVPTVASFPPAQRKIMDILKRNLGTAAAQQPLTIVDLGSGGGQLAWKIARAFSGAHVIGVEISFFPWLRSTIRRYLRGPPNLEYRRTDFWSYDCARTDVVIIFLTENIMEQMGAKLRKELKQGALIVANETPLQAGWNATETIDAGVLAAKLFVYRQT